jgi:hypothetical protein
VDKGGGLEMGKKVGVIVMSIFTLLSLVACSEKDKDSAKTISEYLQDKYNEEFVVDKIGGGYGTLHSNTLKAIVYPKAAPYKKFEVEATKDFTEIWDSYMQIVMAEKLESDLIYQPLEQVKTNIQLKAYLYSSGYPFPHPSLKDTNMSVEDFVSKDIDLILYVFIEGPSDNSNAALQKEMTRRVLDYGFQDAFLRFFYLKSSIFEQLPTQKELLSNHALQYYTQSENSHSFTSVRIKDSRIVN